MSIEGVDAMLKLIMGTAGSGKTSGILEEIRKNALAGEKGQCLIVPEQYSHEAERELCSVCGDDISLYAEVLSFSRLAMRVAQEAGTGGKLSLDKAGRFLCMSLALEQIGSSLRLYTDAKRASEFQFGLFSMIEEFRASGVSPDMLSNAAESCDGRLSQKLLDLSLCLESYNSVLAQGHADPSDRLKRLAETLGESSAYAGQIYIDGFTDFTGMEMLVIEALIKKGAKITVCLSCDGLDGIDEQFEPSRKAAFALLRLAEKHGAETDTTVVSSESGKSPALLFLGDQLFSYTSEKFNDEDGRITLLRCSGKRAECEAAAARCIELVKESGCRWRDLAIAARGFSDYAAPLEDAFRLYGVPLFTARRESILQKPAVALISTAFDIILGGWDLSDVLEYMKTGLTGLSQEDCDTLENYALLWNIRGSYWHRNAALTMHPDGFAKVLDDKSRDKLVHIDKLRRKLSEPLVRLARRGDEAETATQQAIAFSDFLSDIKLPQTLSDHSRELAESGRVQLASELSQLWDIIVRALEQFAGLLGDTPMTQTEFSRLFLKTLSQYDVSVIPSSPDSVTAGEIDRMRRRHIKHLIILGASDDRIPAVSDNGGLLTGDERDELRTLGVDIGGGSDALPREFSLVYNCVTLPSETVTISYCSSDANGAAARPSFLITRAQALFDIRPRTFDLSDARIYAERPAFLLAAEGVPFARSFFSGDLMGEMELAELFARASAERGRLSPPSVDALYGQTKNLSPSQVEAFSNCRLAYFLRYGLRLDEKEQAGFSPPEIGTFLHYVLEKSISEISDTVGFENADEECSRSIADKYTDLYIREKIPDFEDRSQRFKYLFDRMRPSVRRIVCDMVRELSRSAFRPLDFELKFMRDGDLPPVQTEGDDSLRIVGIADRVDGYERDGKLYVRILDYKTGKKKFELSDVWNGMGLQMLIYLFALENEGRERYGKEIVPAGVLYIPAKDSVIGAQSDLDDDRLTKERLKKRKRSGLLLSDEDVIKAMEHGDCFEYIPVDIKKDGSYSADSLASSEQLGELKKFISDKLSCVAAELSGGGIEAEPAYRSESDNACQYCPYLKICRFDDSSGTRRYLAKIKADEFWSKIGGMRNE